MPEGRPSFFATLPGILTGLAALIAALTTLYVTCFKPVSNPPADNPTKAVINPSPSRSNSPLPPELTPPNLISPADKQVFSIYPRHTVLIWSPAKGANSYKVETEFNSGPTWSPLPTIVTQETTYSFDFVGAQPGRWRVTSINGGGKMSAPSSWRTFVYTQ
jgi:hypothetical protein